MENLLNIEFSNGALTVLYMQSEKKQDAILAAILKAVSSDLSMLKHSRLKRINDSEMYILELNKRLRAIFTYSENKVRIADILSTDVIDSYNKAYDKSVNKALQTA